MYWTKLRLPKCQQFSLKSYLKKKQYKSFKPIRRKKMKMYIVRLASILIPILVAAQCYWMRKFREFSPQRRNLLTISLCIQPLASNFRLKLER